MFPDKRGYAGVPGNVRWDEIYPNGTLFPLGMYDIGTTSRRPGDLPEPQEPLEAMLHERQFGWNTVHRYPNTRDVDVVHEIMEETLDLAAQARMGAWIRIPDQVDPDIAGGTMPLPEEIVVPYIQDLAASEQLAWWDMPEERRYWRSKEVQTIVEYGQWTREHDPHRRPTFMYEPNHAPAARMAEILPHLDMVGISCYTNHARNPHAWVRWKMEQGLQAIDMIGASIGPDYLSGQKTPIAALELYSSGPQKPLPTPEGVYHDFWQALASGARGILIYSYYRRLHRDGLLDCLDSYNQAATELTGPAGLDQAALFGEHAADVSAEVVTGPQIVPPFTPTNQPTVEGMPALKMAAWRHHRVAHILVVNSHEEDSVTARLSGMRRREGRVQLPFENDRIALTNGSLDLEVPPLGVRYVRAPAA